MIKNYLTAFFGLCFLVTSCQTDKLKIPQGETTLSLSVFTDDLMEYDYPQTRSNASIDESAGEHDTIEDVNIYLYNDYVTYHVYAAGASPMLQRVMLGQYQLRIICNAGYDMGTGLDPQDLDVLQTGSLLTPNVQSRALMTYSGQIQVVDGSSLFNIPVKRIFARAYLNIQVADDVNLTLKSAKLFNVVDNGYLFAQSGNLNYPAVSDCSGVSEVHTPQGVKQTSDVVYLYENIKPSVPGITSQEQRIHSAAPAGATYVYITATDGASAYNYMIFLGENATDNFSIRRNTSSQYQINITGTNTIDYRVNRVSITATRNTQRMFDLEHYPTRELLLDYGQFQFSCGPAYDALRDECYASFEWRSGSSFPVCYSLDGGVTIRPYTPGDLIQLTASGDHTINFYAAWQSGTIPLLGSDISDVKLYYGPNKTLLRTFSQERLFGYSLEFDHTGIPDPLIDWSTTELDYNAPTEIEKVLAGAKKYFVYSSTARGFIEIRYTAAYQFLGLFTGSHNYNLPEDSSTSSTSYMTEVVDMDTFYKAAGGSTSVTAKFSARRFQNPVTVTTSKLFTGGWFAQVDVHGDCEVTDAGTYIIYTMEAGTAITTFLEDDGDPDYDRLIGIYRKTESEGEKHVTDGGDTTLTIDEDTSLFVKLCDIVALDRDATFANCYIINQPHTKYTFSAFFGGSVSNRLSPATVTVVWANACSGHDDNIADWQERIKYNANTGTVLIDLSKVDKFSGTNVLLQAHDRTGLDHLWSWHLWVDPAYTPAADSRNLMTRNLGALADAAEQSIVASRSGLYYQPGRLEPFMLDRSEVMANDMFDDLATYPTDNLIVTPSGAPLQFHQLSAGYPAATRSSWNSASKADNDPCPYGWRVAALNDLNGLSLRRNAPIQAFYDGDTYLPYFGRMYWNGNVVRVTGSTTNTDKSAYGTYAVRDRLISAYFASNASLATIGLTTDGELMAGMVRCVRE